MSFMNAEMKEAIRYRIEGNDILQQFLSDETGLIGQVGWNKFIRFRIKNRAISRKEEIQFVMENGKRIIGPVFMRGTFLYTYGEDGIYKKW
ncbi:hypothetical protein [Halalkalibacterium halodurans]|uniref:Uncharacterized protein n=1 Tax=Halalkalibacterium halodurans TaxID=86665 RepID=A0A0M0KFM9_ALKHA|nr:hypothetical protein [Halalkalibacterium halodurans]TPE65961.1 hypothetical protein AMD02_019690 [Halalkalibacterium halodurans]